VPTADRRALSLPDALPICSGLDYAAEGVTQKDETSGKDTPVAHTCGHDFHIVCLLGAVQALHTHREHWSGTFIAVFQPGEENARSEEHTSELQSRFDLVCR